MRGDSTLPDGTPSRLNILAGVQYDIDWCTVHFAYRPYMGEPVTTQMFFEVNGDKPIPGQIIPEPVARHFIHNNFLLK